MSDHKAAINNSVTRANHLSTEMDALAARMSDTEKGSEYAAKASRCFVVTSELEAAAARWIKATETFDDLVNSLLPTNEPGKADPEIVEALALAKGRSEAAYLKDAAVKAREGKPGLSAALSDPCGGGCDGEGCRVHNPDNKAKVDAILVRYPQLQGIMALDARTGQAYKVDPHNLLAEDIEKALTAYGVAAPS